MAPLDFLALVLSLSVAAMVWQFLAVRRIRPQLLELAREWGMHYSPGDRFNLAPAIASRLPVAGASRVRVSHLLYGLQEGYYRYVFCVEYTTGVVRSKHRQHCVAAFREPRAAKTAMTPQPLKIAPADIPLIEQYQFLKDVVIEDRASAGAAPK